MSHWVCFIEQRVITLEKENFKFRACVFKSLSYLVNKVTV